MLRINLLLLLAVMLSAIFLVHTQYESRKLFTELDRAESEARRLATDQQRLQVEKRAQATPQRIETMAREKLQMKPASPAITQYVQDGAAAGAVQ
ncbi:cell division protein FtsL [Comamonas guangdongensis]|uniref:Cell division protein FtsL n=1 Tax=Comamonas guangdongensis TaxID=510515 RepID=A0ABV3ZTH1_9BURK